MGPRITAVQVTGMTNDTHNRDWRTPLYEAACRQKEAGNIAGLILAEKSFAFLGNFRDAAKRKEECREEQIRAFEREKKALEEARTSAEARRAASELQAFRGQPCYDQVANLVSEKPDQLFERECRKFRSKSRFRKLAVYGAAVLVLVLIFGWMGPVQIIRYRHAGQLAEDEKYEEALSEYWKLMAGPYANAARPKIPDLQKKLADQMLARGRYQEAEQTYGLVNDEEGQATARIARCQSLAEQKKYTEAIELLMEMEPSANRDSLLETCRRSRCTQAIQEIPSAHKNMDTLRETGQKLDDIDSQLRYCEALKEAGLDPGEVYPDGVEIIDYPLKDYKEQMESTVDTMQEGRILVMRRIPDVKDKSWYRGSVQMVQYSASDVISGDLEKNSEEKLAEEDDRVLLMPAELYRFPEKQRAQSARDCQLLLLAATNWEYYDHIVFIGENRIRLNGRRQTSKTYTPYPVFQAVDTVSLYETKNPEHELLFGGQVSIPQDYKQMDCLDDEGDYDRLWGEPDRRFLQDKLAETITCIIGSK